MNSKIIGFILIGLGVLALAFGGFTYVKSSKTTKLGPIELSLKDKETVNIPVWAGVAAVIAGGVLLAVKRK